MKKIVWYSLLLGAAFLAPVEGTDVAKLLPVELIQLYKEGDTVTIATDAGAKGTGTTVNDAVADMKATATGNVFLDTADYLLIRDLSGEEVETMKNHLKPSVRVCSQMGEIDPTEASAFLRVHKPRQRLKEWSVEKEGDVLSVENGRMILKEN